MKNTKKTPQSKRAKRVESAPEKSVAQPPLTTLLFPFVSNQAGYDTGIAITNPTAEPFCETPQYGSCSIHFFGNVAGGPAPGTQVTGVVPPGGQITFVLSTGGTLNAPLAPGFQGYLIMECWFKNARGFAMIGDVGMKHIATGYLAEVIPSRKAISDRKA